MPTSTTLTQKIQKVLATENYTFKQLADYLQLTEEQLETGLTQKTLELRHLEEISKNLKVPLYSFFRENSETTDAIKAHYTNKIWKQEDSSSPQMLQEEIKLLKQLLFEKEAQLQKLQHQRP